MKQFSDDDLHWLLEVLERDDLAEIEVRQGDSAVVVSAAAAFSSLPAAPAAAGATPGSGLEVDEQNIPVLSPVAGLFYHAPSADAEPFVSVGDEIVYGDTVGLIEAMKLFNEVPAPATGTVVRIVAENGRQVAADEVLMIIRT